MAVDEPIRATRCKPNTGSGCQSDKSRCLTHDLWEELGNQIYLFLSTVSLEDVIEHRVLGRSGQNFIMEHAARISAERKERPAQQQAAE